MIKKNKKQENQNQSPKKNSVLKSMMKVPYADYSKDKKRTSNRTVNLITDESKFAIREAYKMLRTNIVFALPSEESSVIVLTSSWPMEGKTTNAANLAVVFSQMGEKTLLIDGDLRKPRIHKIFKLTSKTGLSNVLRKLCTYEEAVQHTQYENLDILSSGHIPPNPAELLASDEMKSLLDKLKKEYKYILIDTPPVNMVSDAIVLAPVISGMVVVVRQNITVHKSITEALEKIDFAGARVLGFILNDASNGSGDYYSGKNGYGANAAYRRNKYYKNYYGYYGYYGYSDKQMKVLSDKKEENKSEN